ncbi:MAG: hypothetical protein JRJ15_12415 [Deltaproteobacteria bacterium]|nr:hypothetical protein [Deltaproteobacteria bacterium]
MSVGNVSIILILGILNLVLIVFQLCTGMRWIKVAFKTHRKSGIILIISAALHASLAFIANVH